MYTFDKDCNQISKDNFTSFLSEQPYYKIVPIKNVGNYLYYIISKTENSNVLKFYYYRKDIETKSISLIEQKIVLVMLWLVD